MFFFFFVPPFLKPGVAVVLGQSLRPDGTAPQVLLDRALKAKDLLKEGKVSRVIVTGGDPAGVGLTEAFAMRKVLVNAGIPEVARAGNAEKSMGPEREVGIEVGTEV